MTKIFNIEISKELSTEWIPNEKDLRITAQSIIDYYLKIPEIIEKTIINNYDYASLSFDFVFCDSKKTHQINIEYRQKDYPADIITFAVFVDSPAQERFIIEGDINLGEIIIALDKIEESAKKKDIPARNELYFLMSHGILHLLGFDHQNEEDYNFIIKLQKNALEEIGIKYDKV